MHATGYMQAKPRLRHDGGASVLSSDRFYDTLRSTLLVHLTNWQDCSVGRLQRKSRVQLSSISGMVNTECGTQTVAVQSHQLMNAEELTVQWWSRCPIDGRLSGLPFVDVRAGLMLQLHIHNVQPMQKKRTG